MYSGVGTVDGLGLEIVAKSKGDAESGEGLTGFCIRWAGGWITEENCVEPVVFHEELTGGS